MTQPQLGSLDRTYIDPRDALNSCIPVHLVTPADQAQHYSSALTLYDGGTVVVDEVLTMDVTARGIGYGANITMDLNNVGASTGSITITASGKNQFGHDIEEEFALSKAIGTVTGAKIFAGTVVFTVTTVTADTVANDTLDVGFGLKRGLPIELTAITQVVQITRHTSGGTFGVAVDVDTDTVDVANSAVLGTATNGAGSNSGAFADEDSLEVLLRYKTGTGASGDDRRW
jgi:hypothetical protein